MVALFACPSASLRTWKLKLYEDDDDEGQVMVLMVLSCLSFHDWHRSPMPIIAGHFAMFLRSDTRYHT